MKKRILIAILSIVMLVGLMPITAFAATDPSVLVGGVEMYSASGATYYVNGATTAVTTEPNNWNAKYENGILTIKNLSVTGTAASNYAGIYATVGLNIVLEGGNSVTGGAPGTDDVITIAGIYAIGNVTITGSGTLSATGGTATGTSGSRGIVCDNLTLADDDIVINAAGGSTESGSNFGSYGIDAANMNISAGVVNATGGTATGGASRGISATQTVEISGGTVNATGGTAGTSKYSIGIDCSGTLSIGGNATVNATGGSAGKTCGIYSNDVSVTGGVTVATGGTASGTSSGIYHFSSANVTTTGGVLVARSGSGTTAKAINGTLTTNGTKIAGQVVGGEFKDSSVAYDEDATVVALVPNDYTVQNTPITGTNHTIDTNTAVVTPGTSSNGVPLNLTEAGSTITLNGDLVLINLLGEWVTPAFSFSGSSASPAKVTGSGTLTAIGAAKSDGNSYGISASGNSYLTVDGVDVIAIGGTASNKSYGIGAAANVTVSNGGSVVAIGGTASNKSYGIGSYNLSVSDTGNITAIGGAVRDSAFSYGIDTYKASISDTAEVSAMGGTGGSMSASYGVGCSNAVSTDSITVAGGTLNAVAGKTDGDSYGINNAAGKVEIGKSSAGGTVTAVGGAAASFSSGVRGGTVTVESGTLNAVGGITNHTGYGIELKIALKVSGGTVEAVGEDYGIDGQYGQGVTISGGTVTAVGGSVGLISSSSGSLAGGSFTGGEEAISTTSGTVKNLLAEGYGYFAGETQLIPADSDTTVGDPYQVVTVKEIPDPHEHPICGAEHTDIGNHTGACENITWTAVSTEADLKSMMSGGSYYLKNDIELTSTLFVSNINLCLNGFELRQTGNFAVIHPNAGVTLNICDCSEEQTGTIAGGHNNDGAGIYASGGSGSTTTVNIYGGNIIDCEVGAGIGLLYDTTANIYNGKITGNNGGYGGVYCYYGATLNMYGGEISGNTATYAGGGIWLYESTLNLSGNVKISGNTLNGETNNVHIELSDDDPSVVNIGTMSNDAEIGVTIGETGYKEVTPGNYEQYVEFLEGMVSATGASYIDNFFSDVDGYKIVANGDGLDLVKIIEAEWGASADALTESGTLAAALSAAESSDTDVYIRLQTNAELVRPYSFKNGVDVMITLDLNGHNITATLDDSVTRLFGIGYVGSGGSTYGNLTLTDTSSGDKGSITVNTGTVYMCDGSTCHIGGGISIVSTSGYALRFEGGTATAEEGGFSVTSADSNAIYINGATLNGNNISFTAITNSDYYSTAAIYVDQGDVTGLNATVTGPTALSLGHSWYPSKFFNVEITGGTYTGTQYYAIVINNESGENSSLSLKGGTFVTDTEAYGVINIYDGGTVLNTYGALLAENYVYTNEAGSMAIKNETKLAEARTLVVKSIDDVPAGKLIISIEKISTEGLVDTYRITYDDGTTYDFTVTNGAQGIQGIQGNPGADGHTPVITIQGGYWYVDGVNTNQAAQGVKGDTGNGIASIAKTGTEGLVDTYTITFTDGTTTTFTVTNGAQGIQGIQGNPGADGHTPVITIQGGYWYVDGVNTNQAAQGVKGDTGNGIASIAKTGTEGLVDTYTITFTDGTTTTFTVTNGAQGEQGVQGDKGDSGENGKTPTFKIENGELKVSYDNGATWTSLGNVQGANGTDGRNGSNGSNGKDGKDGKDGITPQLRINTETNEWEVSYDNGATWTSLGVKATGDKGDKGDKGDTGATGAAGKDGIDGKDGVDGKDGAVIDKGADGLVIVAIIIGCIAIAGEIAFLVYAIIKKRKSEK